MHAFPPLQNINFSKGHKQLKFKKKSFEWIFSKIKFKVLHYLWHFLNNTSNLVMLTLLLLVM
jgi:hypothetical protein